MKSNRNKSKKATDAVFESITAGKIYAGEINLVANSPQGNKINLSITTDARGYPKIVMGDSLQSPGWPKKQIEIGFPLEGSRSWPHIAFAISYGEEWQAISLGVYERVKLGAIETYPEMVVSGKGNMRFTLALDPKTGTPALVLRAPNSVGKNYVLTNNGPVTDAAEIRRINRVARVELVQPVERRH